MDSKRTPDDIEVIVAIDDSYVDGDKGIFGRVGSPTVTTLSADGIRESLNNTLGALRNIFAQVPDMNPELTLDQVQLTLEVTTTGKVALLGTSAEVAGKGAIAITFKRRTIEK